MFHVNSTTDITGIKQCEMCDHDKCVDGILDTRDLLHRLHLFSSCIRGFRRAAFLFARSLKIYISVKSIF